jgi:hypothetical protein
LPLARFSSGPSLERSPTGKFLIGTTSSAFWQLALGVGAIVVWDQAFELQILMETAQQAKVFKSSLDIAVP